MQTETHELPKDWLELSDIKETNVRCYDTMSQVDDEMLQTMRSGGRLKKTGYKMWAK